MAGDARPNPVSRILAAPFVVLIYAYRVLLSPLMGGRCRFHPSCSQYALDAFAQRPPHTALWLTARRVLRCHPFGGSGYDPVPPRRGGAPDSAGGDRVP